MTKLRYAVAYPIVIVSTVIMVIGMAIMLLASLIADHDFGSDMLDGLERRT